MSQLIKTYETLRQILGFDEGFVIVNKGVSEFIPCPRSHTRHRDLLDSLSLELADSPSVSSLNRMLKSSHRDWVKPLNTISACRRPSVIIGGRPKVYDLLCRREFLGSIDLENSYIIDTDNAKKLCRYHSYGLLLELGLAIVSKAEYNNIFPEFKPAPIASIYPQRAYGFKFISTPTIPLEDQERWFSKEIVRAVVNCSFASEATPLDPEVLRKICSRKYWSYDVYGDKDKYEQDLAKIFQEFDKERKEHPDKDLTISINFGDVELIIRQESH